MVWCYFEKSYYKKLNRNLHRLRVWLVFGIEVCNADSNNFIAATVELHIIRGLLIQTINSENAEI